MFLNHRNTDNLFSVEKYVIRIAKLYICIVLFNIKFSFLLIQIDIFIVPNLVSRSVSFRLHNSKVWSAHNISKNIFKSSNTAHKEHIYNCSTFRYNRWYHLFFTDKGSIWFVYFNKCLMYFGDSLCMALSVYLVLYCTGSQWSCFKMGVMW